jgi:hypothetical protein
LKPPDNSFSNKSIEKNNKEILLSEIQKEEGFKSGFDSRVFSPNLQVTHWSDV